MSSRFVSAGAIDPTTGEAAAVAAPAAIAAAGDHAPTTTDAAPPKPLAKPNDEWLTVEKELEAERRRREEARKAAASGGERSLYEVLQANKEAKQAAFEEANKIKNQFRALDDDEIDFLDEVKARQRQEEDRVRRETEEGVEAFRAAQRQKERAGGVDGGDGDGEEGTEEGGTTAEWAAGGRKRKRVAKGVVGVLKRKATGDSKGEGKPERKEEAGYKAGADPAPVGERRAQAEGKAPEVVSAAKPKAGLVSYDSDSDDD